MLWRFVFRNQTRRAQYLNGQRNHNTTILPSVTAHLNTTQAPGFLGMTSTGSTGSRAISLSNWIATMEIIVYLATTCMCHGELTGSTSIIPMSTSYRTTHKRKLSTMATTPHLHPAPPTIVRIHKQLFRILSTTRTLLRGFPLRCPRVTQDGHQ